MPAFVRVGVQYEGWEVLMLKDLFCGYNVLFCTNYLGELKVPLYIHTAIV